MTLKTYHVLDGHITVDIDTNTVRVIDFDHDKSVIKDTRVLAEFCLQAKNLWPLKVPKHLKHAFNPIPQAVWSVI